MVADRPNSRLSPNSREIIRPRHVTGNHVSRPNRVILQVLSDGLYRENPLLICDSGALHFEDKPVQHESPEPPL